MPSLFLLRIGVVACGAPVDTGLLLNLRFDQDNSPWTQRIVGNGDGPCYPFYQALVGLLDIAKVGDVEEGVLHEAGWAGVCVAESTTFFSVYIPGKPPPTRPPC